jgi:hypothetical protein
MGGVTVVTPDRANVNVVYNNNSLRIPKNQDFTTPGNGPGTASHLESKRTPTSNSLGIPTAVDKGYGLYVTIWAGVKDGRSTWAAARAQLDTASTHGNWVKREIIERAGIENQLLEVVDHPMVHKGHDGKGHIPTQEITLTWFVNTATRTREVTCFIADHLPCDIIFGAQYTAQLSEEAIESPMVLPMFGEPMSKS